MLFNSIPFLLFFAVVTAVFFTSPQPNRNYILLAASYVFYMWWNPALVTLILFTTLVSYAACRIMERNPARRKTTLIVTAVIVFSFLFFFKYYNFFADGAAAFLRLVTGRPYSFHLDILLPVGISFYTFQTVSYVVDVYRGKIAAEHNVFDYALFVSFFPQLLAGPIERPGDLLPQLKAAHRFDAENTIAGAKMMMIGFFEKVAVADLVGVLVNRVYEDIDSANGLAVLIATVLFSVQILGDFKGYSDIAKGIARIYGIRLTSNFNHPYGAASIKEFWNRWHITLSTWFRDYVYFPLGGSRVSLPRWCLNILIVFLLSGLWHGADLTFVLWGLLLAVYRIVERLMTGGKGPTETMQALPTDGEKAVCPHRTARAARHILTLVLIALAWMLFRSNSLSEAAVAYRTLFTDWNLSGTFFTATWQYFDLSPLKLLLLAAALSLFACYERCFAWLNRPRKGKALVLARVGRTALYSIMLWLTIGTFISLNAADVESAFIYFQF